MQEKANGVCVRVWYSFILKAHGRSLYFLLDSGQLLREMISSTKIHNKTIKHLLYLELTYSIENISYEKVKWHLIKGAMISRLVDR